MNAYVTRAKERSLSTLSNNHSYVGCSEAKRHAETILILCLLYESIASSSVARPTAVIENTNSTSDADEVETRRISAPTTP